MSYSAYFLKAGSKMTHLGSMKVKPQRICELYIPYTDEI